MFVQVDEPRHQGVARNVDLLPCHDLDLLFEHDRLDPLPANHDRSLLCARTVEDDPAGEDDAALTAHLRKRIRRRHRLFGAPEHRDDEPRKEAAACTKQAIRLR